MIGSVQQQQQQQGGVSSDERLATALADLDAAEQGYLLGALMIAGTEAIGAQVVAALAGGPGRRCARAAEALDALPRAERLRLTGRLAREIFAPVPAGIDGVHPGWLRQLLEAEPSEIVGVVGAAGPPALRQAAIAVLEGRMAEAGQAPGEGGASAALPLADGIAPDVAAELQRAVLWPLVPVLPVPSSVLRSLGADRRARALAALSRPALAAAIVDAETAQALGAALAAEAEHPDLAVALAQRLPPELGMALLAACPRAHGQAAYADTTPYPPTLPPAAGPLAGVP